MVESDSKPSGSSIESPRKPEIPQKLKTYICNECDLETPSETEADRHAENTHHVLKLRKVTRSQEIEYLIGELHLSGGTSENRLRKIHAVRSLLRLGKSLAWIIGVLDESNTRQKLTTYVHAALRPTIPNLSLRENMVRTAKYEVYGDSRVKIRTVKVEEDE